MARRCAQRSGLSRAHQAKAPKAEGFTNKTVRKDSPTEELERMVNRAKSRVRSRVEHVFGVVKKLWGFSKARYRGLGKNGTRAFVSLAMANIYLARKTLFAQVRAQHGKSRRIARTESQNLLISDAISTGGLKSEVQRPPA